MRKIKKYTINGETMTIAQFAIKYNIPAYVIRHRIILGWTYPDIFSPLQKLGSKRIKHKGEKIN